MGHNLPPGGVPALTPEAQAVLARIGQEPTVPLLQKLKDAPQEFITRFVDDLNPVKQMQKGVNLPTASNPYELMRLTRGTGGKVEHFLRHGTFDFDTFRDTGRGLADILKPYAGEIENVKAYLVAKRALELEGRGIVHGVPLADAQATVAQYGQRYAQVARDVYKYQDSLVDYVQAAGLLDAAGAANMRALNKDYIPFQRVMGETETGAKVGAGFKVRKPVQAIEGSERQLKEPFESIIANTDHMVTLAERNRALQAFTNFAHQRNMAQRVKAMPGQGPRPDEYAVFYDGVRHIYKTDPEIAKIIKGMNASEMDMLTKVLGAPGRLMRAGVVLDPAYMLRNIVRDQTMAGVQSAHNYRPYWDFGKGLKEWMKAGPSYREWMKGGGGQTALQTQDKRSYVSHMLDQYGAPTSYGRQLANQIRWPVDKVRTLSEALDNATRIGEFMRARAAGLDIPASSIAARDVSQDFQRMGQQFKQGLGRAWAGTTPFLTAQIGGVARGVGAMKKNPVRTTSKALALITAPSVLLWLLNRNDPEYQNKLDSEKDSKWHIPIGGGKYLTPPKPFEYGTIFGSGAERLLEKFANDNPRAFRNFEKSVLDAFAPGVVPTFAVPIIEGRPGGTSLHWDTPITPKRLEKERPEFRYTPTTSQTAKLIGRGVAKIPGMETSDLAAPTTIQNYIRAWTGTIGDYVTRGLDEVLKASGAVRRPPPSGESTDVSSWPLIRKFVSAPGRHMQPITDFYQDSTKIKMLARPGYSPADSVVVKQSGDYAADKVYQDRMLTHVDAVRKQMTDYNKELREIAVDLGMPAADKRERVQGIYKEMLGASQEGNRVIRHMQNQPRTIPFESTLFRGGEYVPPAVTKKGTPKRPPALKYGGPQ